MREPRTAETLPKLRFLDRIFPLDRLIMTGAIISVTVFASTFALEPQYRGFLFGVSIALFAWFFTSAINLRNRIKAHTFDLIMRTRFEPTFVESVRGLRNRYPGQDPIPVADAERIHSSHTGADFDLRQHIGAQLNFYEILAISVYYEDADEAILKEYFYDIILGKYNQLQHYIPISRTEDKELGVYFEWLHDRWSAE